MVVYRCRREDGRKIKAAILTRSGPPLEKEKKGEARSYYFIMPDGTPVFDLAKLPEIIESYKDYLR